MKFFLSQIDSLFPLEDQYPVSNDHGNNCERVGLGCSFKVNCPLVGPGPIKGMSSVGVFRRNPSPYLPEFRRKTM